MSLEDTPSIRHEIAQLVLDQKVLRVSCIDEAERRAEAQRVVASLDIADFELRRKTSGELGTQA